MTTIRRSDGVVDAAGGDTPGQSPPAHPTINPAIDAAGVPPPDSFVAEGKETRSGIELFARPRIGFIRPKEPPLSLPPWLEPYRRVLVDGIRTADDLTLAEGLLRLIDPEATARILDATSKVPVKLVEHTEQVEYLGVAKFPGDLVNMDRSARGAPFEIELSLQAVASNPEAKGASVLTLLHELTHAAPIFTLPQDDLVDFERPARGETFYSTYRYISDNLYWDEAFSFAAMARFEQLFSKRTGVKLVSLPAFKANTGMSQEYTRVFAISGASGLFSWVSLDAAYLSYRMTALFAALCMRGGSQKILSPHEIMREIAKEDGGNITPKALGRFYQKQVLPRLDGMGFKLDAILALPRRNQLACFRFFMDFMEMIPERDVDFDRRNKKFMNDFELFVEGIGLILGDPMPAAAEEMTGVSSAGHIPIKLPLVIREDGDLSELTQRPEVVADKVAISAAYEDYVRQVLSLNDDDVIKQWDELLAVAEHADPSRGTQIFERLMELSPKIWGDSDYSLDRGNLWRLGLALIRAGFIEQGRREIATILEHPLGYFHIDAFTTERTDFARHGIADLLEKFISQRAEKSRSLERSGAPIQQIISPLMVILGFAVDDPNLPAIRDMRREAISRLRDLFDELAVKNKLSSEVRYLSAIMESMSDEDERDTFLLLLDLMQAHPELRGLKFLNNSIKSKVKLELFDRRRLWSIYETAVDEQFDKDPDAEPLWVNHLLAIARDRLAHGEEADAVAGWDMLRDIETDLKWLPPHLLKIASESVFRERVDTMIARLWSLPGAKWEAAFDETLEAITKMEPEAVRGRAAIELAAKACEHGHSEWAARALKVASSSSFEETPAAVPAPAPAKEKDGNEKAEGDAIGQDMISVIEAVIEGGERLDRLAADVERDVDSNRGYFRLRSLIRTVQLLASPTVRQGLGSREGMWRPIAERAVDLFVRGGAGHGTVLVMALAGLPVSDHERDAIISVLIDRATPMAGVMAHRGEIHERLYDVFGVWKLADLVLGNKALPESESMLIGRVAALSRLVHFKRGTASSGVMIAAARSVYARTARDNPIHLRSAHRDALAQLRDTDEHRAAIEKLFGSSGETKPAKAPSDTALADYRRLRSNGDARQAQAFLPALRNPLESRLSALASRYHQGRIPLKELERPDFLFGELLHDWSQAAKDGKSELAMGLADLLFHSVDNRGVMARSAWLYAALADSSIPIEYRRMIFIDLKRAFDYSTYVLRSHSEILDAQDMAQEGRFYRLISIHATLRAQNAEVDGRRGSLGLLVALMTTSLKGDAFLDVYSEYVGRRVEDEHTLRRPLDILFAAALSRDPQRALDELFAAMVWSKSKGILNFKAAVLGQASRHFPGALPRLKAMPPQALAELRKGWPAKEITPEQAAAILPYFETFSAELARQQNRVQAGGLDAPEFLHGRDELTRFLLTSFYLELSSGEQQDLLLRMKGVSDDRMLRIFFEATGLEKVGQFLSFWPEVPESLRAELSHLQDQIPAGQIDEVRETVRRELKDLNPAVVEELVSNLDPTPLGSGSIGECYRSWISTRQGRQDVVVKVVPPTKEAKFRRAMKKLQCVRERIMRSADDVPHARETGRVLDLFLNMVEREFDLIHERRQMESARATAPKISAPQVIWLKQTNRADHKGEAQRLASKKVLVMSLANGEKATQIADPMLRADIADRLKEVFLGWIMQRRVYHSDLQPGNILADGSGNITLLDWGQVGELRPQEQQNVVALVAALAMKEADSVTDTLLAMHDSGQARGLPDEKGLRLAVARIVGSAPAIEEHLSETVSQLFRAANDHGLTIALPYVHLLKGIATLEATVSQLRNPVVHPAPALPAAPLISARLMSPPGGDVSPLGSAGAEGEPGVEELSLSVEDGLVDGAFQMISSTPQPVDLVPIIPVGLL
ncbi:MAG: AarF/UbiB family protein [bacterium]